MIKLLGRRGIAAVLSIFLTTMGSAPATAQDAAALKVDSVVRSVNYDLAAQPVVKATAQAGVATAIRTVSRTFGQDSFTANAKWLHDGGWPLAALVDRFATNEQLLKEIPG